MCSLWCICGRVYACQDGTSDVCVVVVAEVGNVGVYGLVLLEGVDLADAKGCAGEGIALVDAREGVNGLGAGRASVDLAARLAVPVLHGGGEARGFVEGDGVRGVARDGGEGGLDVEGYHDFVGV